MRDPTLLQVNVKLEWICSYPKKYYEPNMYFFIFCVHQKILGSSSMHVVTKPCAIYDFVVADSLRDGLVGAPPQLWHRHRKMVASCYSYTAMSTYLNLMNKHASNLASACIKKFDKVDVGQMLDLMSSMSIKITAEIMLGRSSRAEKESETVHHHMKGLKEILNYRTIHRPENSRIAPIGWLK